ncbi:MAG: T9SS type A sorting domain-containing protein [Flavobacteriales bacterium]|nr:T9SS type A sorting domain-containing protein [Flavobacteriales bacterium]
MRKSLLITAFLFTTAITAQQLDWLHGNGVDYDMNPGMPKHSLASAPGLLVSARTTDVRFIYSTEVYGSVTLEKLDPTTGAVELACLLEDSVSVVHAVVDPAGIAYFSGFFIGDELELCDGTSLPGVAGVQFTENLFLMAWDLQTGSALWVRNLTATQPEGFDVGALTVDAQGRLWYAVLEFNDGHVIRVDASGSDVEVRTVGNIRRISGISLDPWGGLYVSGSCDNVTLTFGGQGFPVSSTMGYNMFVLRYKPDGTAGFAEFAPDITFSDPLVVATQDGHAYLAGDQHLDGPGWGGIDFNGPNWGSNIFLVKLDSTGQFLWSAESAPSEGGVLGDLARARGGCVALDQQDRPILMGTLRGLIDWGNGVVSNGQIISQNSITVVAFDGDGTPQWAATSEPSPWFARAQSVVATAEPGVVHFIGHAASEFTFSGHTVGAPGAQTAVVGRIDAISTGVAERPVINALAAWPNPVADVLFVELDATTVVPVEMLNSAGQRVRSLSLVPGRNSIDVRGLATGLYLLRTAMGEAARVVVE